MKPWSIVIIAFLMSCHPRDQGQAQKSGPGHEDNEGRPGLSFTNWSPQTELFMELRALVRGIESPCAAHVTQLVNFAPLAKGQVTVILRRGQVEERFADDRPTVPGIFRPVARPSTLGPHRLLVEIQGEQLSVVHDLGDITVYETAKAAAQAIPAELAPAGRIPFLKEQQWPIEFGTMEVTERTLRPAIRATGNLRARADGEVVITAPAAGRVLSTGAAFPRMGARVTAEQALAVLAPRLDSADQASLDLAVTSARLGLRYAERERQRLEGLRTDGAVPERRALDALRAEEEARAALSAAEQRLEQFRRVQRTQGEKSVGSVQIRSPLSGTLIDVAVAPGSFVEAGTRMFQVADTAQLWLEARVPASDLGRLGAVRGAWFEVEGLEESLEVGSDMLIARGQRIDPETQTVSVIFAIENPGVRLVLGAFASVHLVIGEDLRAPAVPVSALVDDNGQNVVFVQAEGESFERRLVRLGARDRGYVAITSGLKPGEHVVTRGAWSVKLAASSGSIPAHGHSH